ncbi:MAG: hypothetical protein COU07_01710 [Candidatus Harrisonbacteria bacterium CG10_big_fil_rev_8_21_14_0_10_40_38]|uniref:Uncharacterized protein n=1 Tax=Candidatus Harrisonbacteria bacterium CG10_big_fil_rev_8_21_14_0_10_40_38 TaxID=1974583 RepID=A0A2H0UT70_9BACT|nr:MAG: hypothetical protein COU07_01710 [Candidatus Harrisonbacteria bacterium CG10_big_fil_rev_8_21_14_0_10_40_38]
MKNKMENNKDEKRIDDSMKDRILERIESGDVSMRSKKRFLMSTVFWVFGMAAVVLVLLYIVSFIFFTLRYTGAIFAPSFGFMGFGPFIGSMPWILIITGAVFAVLLEFLVRRYPFAYKRPLFYSLAGVVLFALLGGFGLWQSGLHERIFDFSEAKHPPVIEGFYHGYTKRMTRGVHFGIITEITNHGFIVGNQKGEVLDVFITATTTFPLGFDFAEGDPIIILGPRLDHAIRAYGVRRIDFSRESPPPPSARHIMPFDY